MSIPLEKVQTTSFRIRDILGVPDPVTVHIEDYGTGAGSITITCCGNAWTAQFGAIGLLSMPQFIYDCDNDYLINKLWPYGIANNPTKKQSIHLYRILDGVKIAIKENLL
jgi:hypothetical protein